ncbi:MAG: hypothetical protein IJ228_12785 [Succinivibrio sp.]|nr:hypothetical protein [Succinivibrio sp.]
MTDLNDLKNGDYVALIERLGQADIEKFKLEQQNSLKEHLAHAAATPRSYASLQDLKKQRSQPKAETAVRLQAPGNVAPEGRPRYSAAQSPAGAAPRRSTASQIKAEAAAVGPDQNSGVRNNTASNKPFKVVATVLLLVFGLMGLINLGRDTEFSIFCAFACGIIGVALYTSNRERRRKKSQRP